MSALTDRLYAARIEAMKFHNPRHHDFQFWVSPDIADDFKKDRYQLLADGSRQDSTQVLSGGTPVMRFEGIPLVQDATLPEDTVEILAVPKR